MQTQSLTPYRTPEVEPIDIGFLPPNPRDGVAEARYLLGSVAAATAVVLVVACICFAWGM